MKEAMAKPKSAKLTAVSLFASSGIGDLALRAAGAEVLVANEYRADRAQLFRQNYPEVEMICGDIRELTAEIEAETVERLAGRDLDILFATPPCQGMSKNGRGKLLKGVREGFRDVIDPRNQLATLVPPIVSKLKPKLVVFENVPEMLGTLVEDEGGELVELVGYLGKRMDGYEKRLKVVEFANYGVPQRRQRLITVFVRADIAGPLDNLQDRIFPPETHSSKANLLQLPWITVNDVIGDLPPIDSRNSTSAKSPLPFHYVPVLDDKKYWWVSNTPPGSSAFDNQCVNPDCQNQENKTHSSSPTSDGINRASRTTPIYCEQCGFLLPRPMVEENGEPRLMKGFTSAYKRMRGDLPASAITTNLSYVMSDQKIHPTQHRPLSLLEAMRLHTVTDYPWEWQIAGAKPASDKLIRESLGESIPPRGLEIIFRQMFVEVLGYNFEARDNLEF